MRSHRRVLGIAKWAGICLCALILIAWGVSVRWFVLWSGYRWGRLEYGNIGVGWYLASRAEYDQARANPAASYLQLSPDLLVGRIPAVWRIAGGYGFNLPKTIEYTGPPGPYARELFIPLWIPFLIIAAPTGFAIWRERQPPPGHCRRCGYDLTGNVSGICPECGTAVPALPTAPAGQASKSS